jgi:hypothetical protein
MLIALMRINRHGASSNNSSTLIGEVVFRAAWTAIQRVVTPMTMLDRDQRHPSEPSR